MRHQVAYRHLCGGGLGGKCPIAVQRIEHTHGREFWEVLGHRVIQSQLTPLPQHQSRCGGQSLALRTDSKQVVLAHGETRHGVGHAIGLVYGHLAVTRNEQHRTWDFARLHRPLYGAVEPFPICLPSTAWPWPIGGVAILKHDIGVE